MNTLDHCVYLILTARLEKRRAEDRESYFRRRDSRLLSMQAWKDANRAKVRAASLSHYYANKAACKASHAAWLKENRERTNKTKRVWAQEKRDHDLGFKLSLNFRIRIWGALRGKATKAAKTLELLGCDIEQFRLHLEERFLPGMTWKNHGRRGWHIDHIRPCASFDLVQPEQQRACFHYTNLQPLWAADNIRKGAKCLI